ncbi:MAG TPA: ABC transporter ATP-binding protein [Tepidiformaceae bacterium]|nr:ABC transporter ATP-binding protein [Tepidiformaceae bacterium]
MSDPVVRAAGLAKHYGGHVALHELDLELHAGEVFGFLGPNGAGKTTTVKLLLGLVRPSHGRVELFGRPLQGHATGLLRDVGAIVEAPAFYPYLSGRDNLLVLARLAGIAESRIDEALERVGLTGAEQHKFAHYSVGMKQRLGIASVLLRDPRLIILDEPTSGLDPQGQRYVDTLLRDLAREGRTVFLSSHSMQEVEQICDRVAIMRSGRKLLEGAVADLVHGSAQIALRVPDAEAARRVLSALPWVRDVICEAEYLLVEAPVSRAGDINAALAAAGIYLTELRPRERSIATFYHEVMDGEEAA